MLSRQQAKRQLKSKGWSYRAAAPRLGVHWAHLAKVLTGVRTSRRLLRKIELLPSADEVATVHNGSKEGGV